MLDMRHIFHTRICYKFGQKFCLYKKCKERKRNSNDKAEVIFSSSSLFICLLLEIVWSYGAIYWKRKGGLSRYPCKGKDQIRARDSRAGD